jgi:SAM-dependent methyltransferase
MPYYDGNIFPPTFNQKRDILEMIRSGSPEAKIFCRRRTACRLCGGKALSLVLSLTPTPLANALLSDEVLNNKEEYFPLDLFFCDHCQHLQLLDIVDPATLFENYVYVSGTSPVFVRHFESYAEDIICRFRLKSGDLIVEVGSNDGTLLRFFKQSGMRVLGVDPAKEIAKAATASGIETWPEFFSQAVASRILKTHGPAAVVCANNVFAHIDDLKGMVQNTCDLLGPAGVFVFEVSYLLDVYEKTLFDTIYHEHLDYHSVKPLDNFFKAQGLELIEAIRVSTHGGSLRGITQKRGGPHAQDPSVKELIDKEIRVGLDRSQTFHDFARRINQRKFELTRFLKEIKSQGKTIAGFGAPAKATTLMHHFGLGKEVIDFIVDSNPLKQGLFTPGLHVPILPPQSVQERRPDYILILAWNFAPSIIESLKPFQNSGGRFIVPLPDLKVY